MDYFEAINGEKTAENAFLEASAEDNYIILFIHGRLRLKEEECGREIGIKWEEKDKREFEE